MHSTNLLWMWAGCWALSVTPAQAQPNLTALLSSNNDLSIFNALLGQHFQFAAALASTGNLTVFAPSNDAFAAYLNSSNSPAAATSQPAFIQDLLRYHVINGSSDYPYPAELGVTYGPLNASVIRATPAFAHTLLADPAYTKVSAGQAIEVRLVDASIEIFSGFKSVATVTQADIAFSGDGVLHVIDTVLIPPPNIETTAEAANLTAFLGLLITANLLRDFDATSDITIFAPTNAAFQAVASAFDNMTPDKAAKLAKFHIANGVNRPFYSSEIALNLDWQIGSGLSPKVVNGSIAVWQAHVINPDILIAGGVMHIIDCVLNPDNPTLSTITNTGSTIAFLDAGSNSTVPFTQLVPIPTTIVAALVATAPIVTYSAPIVAGMVPSVGAGRSTASTSGGASTAPPVSSSSSGAAGTANGTPTGLSGGAIAGIVIGVIALIILGVVAILLYRRRKTRQQKLEKPVPTMEVTGSDGPAPGNVLLRAEMEAEETKIHEIGHHPLAVPELGADSRLAHARAAQELGADSRLAHAELPTSPQAHELLA